MGNNHKILVRLVIGVFAFIFLFSYTLVFSADKSGLKISPITFKFSLAPNEKRTDLINITNPNTFNLEIETEVEDFLMEDEEGTPRFLPQGSGKTTLSKWISVSEKKFTLEPYETKEVNFVITSPLNAEPGGHYAAVFFRTIPNNNEDSEAQINISSRVGSLILVSVDGEVNQNGEIAEFKAPKFSDKGPIDFLARFKNIGTVHYQLNGEVKIFNLFNKETGQISLPEHIVLPDSIRLFEGRWEKHYPIGRYKAQLSMTDGSGMVRTSQFYFFVFLWKEALLILIGVVVVGLIINFIRKKIKISVR